MPSWIFEGFLTIYLSKFFAKPPLPKPKTPKTNTIFLTQVVYKVPKIPSLKIFCTEKLWTKNLHPEFDIFSENPKFLKKENHLRPMSIDLAFLGGFYVFKMTDLTLYTTFLVTIFTLYSFAQSTDRISTIHNFISTTSQTPSKCSSLYQKFCDIFFFPKIFGIASSKNFMIPSIWVIR